MSNLPYSITLKTFCESALLFLYISVSELKANQGFVPTATRNKILSSFIKSRMKDPQYKSIKKEMKRFINIPVKNSMEMAFVSVLDTLTPMKGKNDAEMHFIDFLARMYDKTSLMVDLQRNGTTILPRHLYVVNDEFFNNVNNNGEYMKPVTLRTAKEDLDAVLLAITDDNVFDFSIEEHDGQLINISVWPK